ncbi:MAG: HTH domain-containing protein [Nanoarchaeota archaeon]
MAEKTRIIDISEKGGTFSSVFRRFTGHEEEYNVKDLSILRQLLSNEKARLLYIIKTKKPLSIYALAKILKRDFKTVREDILLLKKFGFLDIVETKTKGKRISHKPIITASTINISVRI